MKPEASANERFLSRWSRLKRESAAPATSAPSSDAANAAVPSPTNPPAVVGAVAEELQPLPPIDSLTIESDFAPFFQPRVPDALRRAAVKKLFADPHFNVMDGLDTYIDDYTKADPLPAGMLEQLLHAKDLLHHPSTRREEEQARADAAAALIASNDVDALASAGTGAAAADSSEIQPAAPEHQDAQALPAASSNLPASQKVSDA